MKLLTGCLTLAAMLCCMPASQADFVFDDFEGSGAGTFNTFTPGGPFTAALDDDAAGTRSLSFSGAFSQVTFGSSFAALGTAAGSQFTISYDLDAPFDLHSTGAFPGNPLLLDLFDTVTGAWSLVATYSSSTTGESATFAPIAITSSGPIGLDGTDLGRGALASTVDGIDLEFTVTAPVDAVTPATFGGNFSSIAAVPEPASIALLGLTGLGGVVVARRRRKNAMQAA